VNHQRRGKKKLDHGESSDGMMAERAAKMDALGFAWEGLHGGHANDAKWEAQLAKLVAYKAEHGDCNVPRGFRAKDPPMATWAATQRVFKKRLDRGEPSEGMMAEWAANVREYPFQREHSC
jgi:hypothetical protein